MSLLDTREGHDVKVPPGTLAAPAPGNEEQGLDLFIIDPEQNLVELKGFGFVVQVNKQRAAEYSNVLKTAIENDSKATSIELKVSDRETPYKNAIEAMARFINENETKDIIPHPLRSSVLRENENCTDWHVEFLDGFKDMRQLYDVAHVADYYDIPVLLNLICAKIASEVKGCPVDDIKKRLEDNYTFKKERDKQVQIESKV